MAALSSGRPKLRPLAFFVMIAGILPGWGIWRLYPAIALSDDGMFAYLWGKPWRFIGWGEIVSITRHTKQFKGAPRPWLGIKGLRYTIRVYESIDRFADFSECLTRYHGLSRRSW
jgi:hypothetical protein